MCFARPCGTPSAMATSAASVNTDVQVREVGDTRLARVRRTHAPGEFADIQRVVAGLHEPPRDEIELAGRRVPRVQLDDSTRERVEEVGLGEVVDEGSVSCRSGTSRPSRLRFPNLSVGLTTWSPGSPSSLSKSPTGPPAVPRSTASCTAWRDRARHPRRTVCRSARA